MKRKIVEIDQEKCNGCGQCVTACHESAIQMVNGKAQLVSDVYCDGLGACIGDCPVDAIKLIEREADEFNEEAVKVKKSREEASNKHAHACECPGMAIKSFPKMQTQEKSDQAGDAQSELAQWPIQLHLVPVNAPYWKNASLLIAADCTAFSMGSFHNKMLKDKKLVIACPKLDDTEHYVEKLASIIGENNLKDLTVVYMEVPCCRGIVSITQDAIAQSGKSISLNLVKLSLEGKVL